MTGGPPETQGTPLQPAYACGSLRNEGLAQSNPRAKKDLR
jgi:hypothetical protein